MRIMVDSNIVISALLFPNGRISALMREVLLKHTICMASFSLDEIEKVIRRKFLAELEIFDTFLNEMPYEILRTPDKLSDTPEIRDYNDRPILATALLGDVDILLTGDKDFADVVMERPIIMTAAQFAAAYL